MQARDVMTTSIVTVNLDTMVSEIARTLLAHNIGAVPVVDDTSGAVAGIVSESDLLRRSETGTLRERRSWLAYFEAPASLAAEYTRLHGTRARDVMRTDIRSVAPDTDLLDVVDLMERRRIRRVLVMEDGRLHGIVCRSDLLRGMLAAREETDTRDADRAIKEKLLDEINDQPWRTIAGNNIIVTNGVVSFWGTVDSDEELEALRVAAENIAGVVRVEDRTVAPQPRVPPLSELSS